MNFRDFWLVVGIIGLCSGTLWAKECGTSTPTPTATPGASQIMIYNNSDKSVAAALGCPVSIVDQVQQLNLDITTSYIIMRLCALGESLQVIMQMRLTMGWDEICAQFGIDWSSFSSDLQTRTDALQPEMITPDQVLRGSANDPNQFPSAVPSPMPNNLLAGAPLKEVCPLCK